MRFIYAEDCSTMSALNRFHYFRSLKTFLNCIKTLSTKKESSWIYNKYSLPIRKVNFLCASVSRHLLIQVQIRKQAEPQKTQKLKKLQTSITFLNVGMEEAKQRVLEPTTWKTMNKMKTGLVFLFHIK